MKKAGLIVLAILLLAALVQFFLLLRDLTAAKEKMVNRMISTSGEKPAGVDAAPPQPDPTLDAPRTGSAKFTAIGTDGKAVEGVTIRLTVMNYDPRNRRPPEPTKSTKADGIARWEGLAPESKCEWKVVSGHPVEPGEGIEHGGSKAIQLEDGRWAMRSGSDSPFEAKGKFTVAAGEEFAITLKVKKTSTVLCRLGVGPDAAGTARVELWNKGELPTPSGTFKDHRPERQADVGAGSEISFAHLTPGSKYLRAAWWEAPGRRGYARLNFELGEGETKDLGTLPRITGGSLELRIVLQGPAEAIERVERPARATIMVSSHSPTNDDLSVVDYVEAEIGSPITLTGLNGNRAFVNVNPLLRIREGPSVVDCRRVPPLEIALPVSAPVEVPVILEIKHWFKFNVTFPPLATQTTFFGYAFPAGGGAMISLGGPGRQPGDTLARFTSYVLPGDYEILVHSLGALNVFATGQLTIRPDGTHDLKLGELKAGAILRGRALTKGGNPYKYPLHFRRAGAPQENGIYYGEVDAEGRFMIGGIVPNSRLTQALFSPADVVVGEAGSETWVDLTKQD